MRLAPALCLIAGLLFLAACSNLPPPPVRLALPNALHVDLANQRAVLPVARGRSGTKDVWYIVTDASTAEEASALGVVHAPLLKDVTIVQNVRRENGILNFPAAPDFSARRHFQPGPQGFPPAAAAPGATASDAYSPFIRIDGSDTVLNAPIIAVGTGPFDVAGRTDVHDRVLALDTRRKTVTLLLSRGFAEGRAVSYISTEATDPGVAAMERATYVPGLAGTEGDVAILAIANGPTGRTNPEAQGLAFASLDGGLADEPTYAESARLLAPGNILTTIPSGRTAAAYTPLWGVSLAIWSEAARRDGQIRQLRDQTTVYRLAQAKSLTGPEGKPVGPVGILVNCPVIAYHD